MGRKCMGKQDIGKIPDVMPHSDNISKTTDAISQEEKGGACVVWSHGRDAENLSTVFSAQ